MELYRKHRPTDLSQIVGNSSTTKSLSKIKEFPHAILLHGPRGCGKTTIGRIIAGMIGSSGMDFVELDTGIYRGIDTVRDLRKNMVFKPVISDARVWLLDEFHNFGTGGSSKKNIAQTAMLKALEEAPDHVYFILCTTNPEMILSTIRSRCASFAVSALDDDEMEELITKIARKERKKKLPNTVIQEIVDCAEGHPRDALMLLDNVLLHKKEKDMLASINAIDEEKELNELCQALLKGVPWQKVSKIINSLPQTTPSNVRRAVLNYMSAVLRNSKKGNDRAWYVMSWFQSLEAYTDIPSDITFVCYAICKELDGPF